MSEVSSVIELRPGAVRSTVQVLAAGQPRPYADSRRHVRVMFEQIPYTGDPIWQPWDIKNEAVVRERLSGLMCGFTEFTYPPKDREPTTADYFATRLDYLKRVGPGVWEFHTTSAFTD